MFEEKEDIICQRENPFYIDTVKNFRDMRYTYKGLAKDWLKKKEEAEAGGDPGQIKEAKDLVLLYDSLQLAHKVYFNFFFGVILSFSNI